MARRRDAGGRAADALLADAMRHHRAGRLDLAAALYERILSSAPGQADALHLLGVVALQRGDAARATGLIARAIAARPGVPAYHMNLGEAQRLAGRPAEAAAAYEQVLALKPDHFGARNNLANIRLGEGRTAEAIAHYRTLVSQRPEAPDGHYNLANALAAAGEAEAAETTYRALLAQAPSHAGAAVNLAQILAGRGETAAAAELFRRALATEPDLPEAHYGLANALRDAGDIEAAISAYEAAIAAQPDFVEAIFNLGAAEQDRGAFAAAEAHYRRVLEIEPDHARAHNNLGTVLAETTRHDEAIAAYGRAIALAPNEAEARVNLGNAYLEQGRIEPAAAAYRAALAIEPADGLRLKLALLLPVIPGSMAEIEAARARFAAGIEALEAADIRLRDPLAEVGQTSFYLAYHGHDDRALQERLAALYARACPELLYAAPHCDGQDGTRPGARIRVGFVSRFLREHTIGRLVREQIARLDRRRFHVTAFFFPQAEDATTHYIRTHADTAVTLPPDLAAARARIAEARLDVLYYTDIGMEPVSYFLAFARLAPVQCTTWGHPDTTGLPSIDYFVSCEGLEPAGAEAHYSEQLVRLPTYNTCYRRPARPQPLPTRAELGLPADGTLYLCPQSLFKFRPDFDRLLARILDGDGAGRLMLVGGTNPYWSGLLEARLRAALGPAADRLHFAPRLDYRAFHGLLAAADVMLDTTVFCGANTTLEGLAMGTPIVTLPGDFARGRMTYACYRKMDYMDLVATDEDDYVRLALALGTDPARRAAARERIDANSEVLYEDDRAVRELEGFLAQAVAGA